MKRLPSVSLNEDDDEDESEAAEAKLCPLCRQVLPFDVDFYLEDYIEEATEYDEAHTLRNFDTLDRQRQAVDALTADERSALEREGFNTEKMRFEMRDGDILFEATDDGEIKTRSWPPGHMNRLCEVRQAQREVGPIFERANFSAIVWKTFHTFLPNEYLTEETISLIQTLTEANMLRLFQLANRNAILQDRRAIDRSDVAQARPFYR